MYKYQRRALGIFIGVIVGIVLSIWIFFPYDLTAGTDEALANRAIVALLIFFGALFGWLIAA